MRDKIKILFLSANPWTTTRLSVEAEMREIQKKLEQSSTKDSFELFIDSPTRFEDLRRMLLDHKPHIVHFSGHGSREQIMLEHSKGYGMATDTMILVDAFRQSKDFLRVILLNSCLSERQAIALESVVDYTIGIERSVGDKAAITFAGAFYEALGFGKPVEDAYASAQTELRLRGLSQPRGFKFFVREGVDPAVRFSPVLAQMARQDSSWALALRKLVEGEANSEQVRIVRKATLDGSVVLEQLEEAIEGEVTFLQSVAASASTKTLRAQVHPNTYRVLQERLFPPPPGIGPPLPSLIVVGREKSLVEVKKLLSANPIETAKNLIVIRGWPGVGKTTLVGALGRDPEVLSAFPDGVLWTSLEREPELISKIAEWGRALGTDQMLRSPTIDDAVATLGSMLRDRKMLLIVDDIWKSEHALPFIKAATGSQCTILATTRLPHVANTLTTDPDRIYLLPVLTEKDSLALLSYLAGDVVAQYPEACRELVNHLGNLPLALQVAGRLLRAEAELGFDVVELIKKIREGAAILAEPAPLDRAEGVVIPAVQALLKSNTDELDEFTRECFAILGVFAPKPATFDVAALKAVWDVPDPTLVIRKLAGHGLLEPIGEGRFQMHELLVKHAASLLV
jgi:hypothetical protein